MKKIVLWVVIPVLIIAGVLGHNRFIYGNLKIDRELVSDENLNLLADNWEKLSKSQNLTSGEEAFVYEDGTIGWSASIDEKSLAFFTVMPNANSDDAVNIAATYHRNGLGVWLHEFNTGKEYSRFGESRNNIYVQNSRLEIIYLEFEAEANAVNFENWFRELLQTAQS